MRSSRPLWCAAVAVAAMIVLGRVEAWGRIVGLPLPVVNAAAVGYFAILVAAPLVLHPIAFFGGASAGRRVLLALVPAAWWWLTEVVFRLRLHTLLEAVYLTFSLVTVFWLHLLALELLLAELACRAVARWRTGGRVRVLTRGTVLGLVAFVALVLSAPVVLPPYYEAFQRGYRDLFLEGQLPLPESFVGPLDPETVEAAAPDAARPNLVVIFSDDHRADFLGSAGHPFVETPALDRLAAEGTRFTNAFVVSSLCSPSRATVLTGQYAAQHGVFNNFTPWSDENRTFFEYLKAAGYDTAFVGKWHMPGSLPDLRGVDRFVTFDAFGGQGLYWDTPLIVDGERLPASDEYIAEELTDRAVDFLREPRDRPFALFLSHKSVHSPFQPAPEEAGRYAAEPVALPAEAHSWVGWVDGQYVHMNPFSLETEVRLYGETVASMDREIGRVLGALDELGLAGDTVVIYTSDNGYLWGEHRLIDKRWPYEESIRVPLIVRDPASGRAGASVDALVSNLDVAPTLLAAAGIEVPEHMRGRSLHPLLDGTATKVRDEVYYSYYFEPPFPVPTVHALRTARHKYVEYEGRAPELYDVVDDPQEMRNLVGTEAGDRLVPELRARLHRARREAEAR